ncbi:MAG: hypothetical protein JSV67_01375, partial [Thermoplasmatales archaeon]
GEESSTKDSIIIGINQDVFGFHPWMETLDATSISVNKNIFNTLVGVDEIYRFTSELAKSWNNPDNLTWRFYLREDVKFHNGYNFTAQDVNYTINLIKSNTSNIFNELLVNVEEVIVINNYTLDIKTIKPCPTFLNKLIDIMIISKEYQETTSTKKPIGTGAYKFVEQKPGEHIILERFENYWKELSDIKTVKFKIIEDSVLRKNALINKSVDIAETIHPEYYEELSSLEGFKIKNVDTPTVYYLSFDFRENTTTLSDGVNPFSHVEIRKAMYHSINISEIIDKYLYGFGTEISQFVSPLIFGYNPNIKRASYNLTIARELMKDVGFESGFNISLDCPDENLMKNISNEIANQLLEINITVNLNILSIFDWLNNMYERNTSFYLSGWIPSGVDGGEIYDYLLRSVDDNNNIGTFNAGYYSNPEVDRIGEEITFIMDYKSRLQLIQQGFAIAMEDVAWIPLFSIQWLYGISDDIEFNPRPDLNIKLEEIKLKN